MPASYPPVVGGLQTVAHNLAKQLLKRGHEARIVTNRYPIDLPPREHVEGVLVDRVLLLKPSLDQLRRRRPDLFLAALYYGPKSYWRLTNVFNEFRPDVVNIHFPDHQISAVLRLRKRFKFRLVVSLHGDDVERFAEGTSRGDLPQFRAVLQAADAVTAVSRDLLDKAKTIEPAIDGKSHVIHNGIDVRRFAEKSRHDHPRPYVLGVGRLVYKKGFDLLVEAFAQCVRENGPDLIIAGSGEQRNILEQQVERLGLREKIHFYGQAPPEEVVKLMNGSLGIVVPSRREPFGIVALEAAAAGKPVVATDVDGLREFMLPLISQQAMSSETNGHAHLMLVDPSPSGIATGLRELFQNAANGSTRDYALSKEFSWDRVALNYERVLMGS